VEINHNKLVRDNIPDIIKADGRTPVVRRLTNCEYINALHKKLLEEVNEYLDNNSIEELADILEVVSAIAKANGYSDEDLEKCRENKRLQNGGFEKRLFLEKVMPS